MMALGKPDLPGELLEESEMNRHKAIIHGIWEGNKRNYHLHSAKNVGTGPEGEQGLELAVRVVEREKPDNVLHEGECLIPHPVRNGSKVRRGYRQTVLKKLGWGARWITSRDVSDQGGRF